MIKIFHLIQNDLRHIVRDRMLFYFLFMPFLIILAVNYLVPLLIEEFPIVADYQLYIMMSASLQTSIMFGFVYAFIFLEEKDEQVLQAIRILPISTFYFIVYRMLFATMLSFVGAFLTMTLCGLAYPGIVNVVLLAILYAFNAPFMALFVAAFSENKVAGMAWFKIVNLVVLLPMLAFFLPVTKYFFFLLPTYWIFKLYETGIQGGDIMFTFLVGFIVSFLALTVVYVQFRKRVFER